MSSSDHQEEQNPLIFHAEMRAEEADKLIGELLRDNIEIARELQEYIFETASEGPAGLELRNNDRERGRSLAEMHEKTRTRMRALLAEPARQRRQAIRFLESILTLVRVRAGFDPRRITNSPEHVKATIELMMKVNDLMKQFRQIEVILESSLRQEEGVVKCSSHNVALLRGGLDFAARQISHLRTLQAVPHDAYDTKDEVLIRPAQEVVDIFARLKESKKPLENRQELARVFDLLSDYLRGLVQKTGLYVEIDTRKSVEQFRLLAEEVGLFSGLTSDAEAGSRDVSDAVKQEWEKTLMDTSFEIALPSTRVEMLYQPMTEDFLGLIDLEVMDEESNALHRENVGIKKQKKEMLRVQESAIRRMIETLKKLLFPRPESPPPTLTQLSARQRWLEQRIRELGRAREQKRRLER